MKQSFLAEAIAYFFIFLFLYTGVIKLTEISTFRQELSSSPLMSSMAGFITWALPIAEVLLAVALFLPRTRLPALYFTAGLMIVFTIYVIYVLLLDNQISCSCGGIIEELSPKQHIVFNSACVILSIVGILASRRRQATPKFRWVTSSSAIGLFAIVGWLLVSAFTAPAVPKTGLEGRLIPPIQMLLVDSTTILNTSDIPEGKPFILLGFDPWCKHCQAMTVDIKKHMADFGNTRIYYMTGAAFTNMRTFYNYFKLFQFPNITMGRDTTYGLFRYFHRTTTPVIAVFDAKKRLKTMFPGELTSARLAALTKE